MAALKDWLQGIRCVAGADPVPASTDASFRRYFRLQSGSASYIAMDAPPESEDSAPFVRVAGYLESMHLNAPRVIQADLGNGFLLLTDLGTTHYLERLRDDPADAAMLYDAAIDALLVMQSRGTEFQESLPPYDEALLRFELSLFHDWLCQKHLGLEFGAAAESAWRTLCDRLVANALAQPRVFVHRDYHSRNLMVVDGASPGILDFQDAVEGPLTYDLVSLLRDCYISPPVDFVAERVIRFHVASMAAGLHGLTAGEFRRSFDLMGVQRHLKAAGIFARLNHRDGKSGYLADIPRTLGYIISTGKDYPQLDFLVDWIETRVLPGLEAAA